MKRKFFQIGLLLAAMVLIAVAIAWFFPGTSTPPPVKPLPNPNGYTFLVEAGRMIRGSVGDFSRLNHEQLRALVQAHTNALELAREGLKFECRVPLEYSRAYSSKHVVDLAALKRLAQALAAEGRLAELEQRTNDAAKSYLDLARLGVESARGGTVIDALVGKNIEDIGNSLLRRMVNSLDAGSCREIAQTLESLESHREPWQTTTERDRNWSRSIYTSFNDRWRRLVTAVSSREAITRAELRFNRELSRTRGLMIDFAARAYELENHRESTGFDDLVPEYLESIPLDPLTGTNMVFPPPR